MRKQILTILLLGLLPGLAVAQQKRYGIRPELIRGPYLQVATAHSMIIRWRTDELDVSFVRYGTGADRLDRLAGDANRTQEHVVTLTGLDPETKYYYLLEGARDTLQGDENNCFTTLPLAGKAGKYRIGVFGDCGTNSVNQRNTRDQFEKYLGNDLLNAWILLGDNAYSFGKDSEFQSNFFNIYKGNLLKKSPLFPAPGNHDYKDEPYSAEVAQRSGEIAYYKNFTMPARGEAGGVPSHTSAFYSFDIGNIHFLSLDSHGEEDHASRLFDTAGRQVRWVKEDLEANKNKGWVVAYWHHPPYSMGSHNSDTEEQMVKIRENFVRILERYGVDLILCGHSHSYERSKLMQGHYGPEATFSADKHLLSNSSGRYEEDRSKAGQYKAGGYDGKNNSCPYLKGADGKGTVYVVSGSAGQVYGNQESFPHEALPYSDVSNGGSCILEVEANRLDLKWICADGIIRDRFTMMKEVNKKMIIQAKEGETVTLKASFIGRYQWAGRPDTTRSIEIKPPAGVTEYIVKDPLHCVEDKFIVTVTASSYNPRFWTDANLTGAPGSRVGQLYDKGWKGLLYWGADRAGDTMKYHFNSPFLARQPWARAGEDKLGPLVRAAHGKGMKVMVNMEDVNPYHWQQHKWTPETIRAVGDDLARQGADAVFEECFEVEPAVFKSLAGSLGSKGVDYISGTDPMLLREPGFAALWPETGTINIYNYNLKRDKVYGIAALAQHGSLGYGWAKYWGKPTALTAPIDRDWGIACDYSPAVVSYLCMIRALQFRTANFIIFGGSGTFDPLKTQAWIREYVDKQEKNRPLLNIVALLDQKGDRSGWNRLFNSGDAITSGVMNGGYDLVVSDKVVPADAYWIYTPGGKTDRLPAEVVDLFSTGKPVFLQTAYGIPGGPGIYPEWKRVLALCGVDGTLPFRYAQGSDHQPRAIQGASQSTTQSTTQDATQSATPRAIQGTTQSAAQRASQGLLADQSLPENQAEAIPYTGYYKNHYLRFTGFDAQHGTDIRAGTVLPKEAIKGQVLAIPNQTYGEGPYMIGKGNKYLVTTAALSSEVAYPVSDLLSGSGILPGSNVWGIAGKQVTALLAIENTALEMTIPGLQDGAGIHVVVWDKLGKKSLEETGIYKAPYKLMLQEYDLLLIDALP